MDAEKYVKDEIDDLKEIKKRPYSYICDYVESIYPNIGYKTFKILALLPCSLIIPDLPFGSKKVRTNLNCLLLAGSGSGKTSIAKLFANITFSPLELESVTSAKLESTIAQMEGTFSLIVGDFARMSKDPTLIKVIEGLLGEEKSMSRKTMRKDIEMEVNGVALLCGISTDLSHYILSGLLFRTIPILIGHTSEEHEHIGEHIKDKIGNGEESNQEKIIKDYYMELARIQTNPSTLIRGFNIKKEYRAKAYNEWKKLTTPIVKDIGFNFFRELQEFFRFLCSSAFLNYFIREKQGLINDGILTPSEEDFKIALKLMKESILFKFRLIRAESYSKGIKNAKEFKEILKSDKVKEEYKEILRNLVKIKEGRISRR